MAGSGTRAKSVVLLGRGGFARGGSGGAEHATRQSLAPSPNDQPGPGIVSRRSIPSLLD